MQLAVAVVAVERLPVQVSLAAVDRAGGLVAVKVLLPSPAVRELQDKDLLAGLMQIFLTMAQAAVALEELGKITVPMVQVGTEELV
jgi:hypothetical protein